VCMQTAPSSPKKPITDLWRPELTRLPRLTPVRRVFRRLVRLLCRFLVLVCTRTTIRGLENFPAQGPALVVTNHLGDADLLVLQACLPACGEILVKIELYDFPLLGALLEAFGVIWVHRGRPDRRALSAALEGLRQGRFVALAPEGRESLTGTQNRLLLGHLKKLRRAPVVLRVGRPFVLSPRPGRRQAFQEGTRRIMETLARQLPPELRGAYGYLRD
jgi:1-acyl-sn-glycerol-3-phosphate acyltransferase